MLNVKTKNTAIVVLMTMLVGAVVGLVLWLLLEAVSLGKLLIWDIVPSHIGGQWILVPLCALGGCLTGILHKRYGDYPDELDTVIEKVKRDKHYDYRPMLVMLVCTLLPLMFGSSVGPEAGLTGIIAALCYWIGDNVKMAEQDAALYSELGETITLGHIFHMPLFGILAVEEMPANKPANYEAAPNLPRFRKLVLYGIAIAASFLVVSGLNRLSHTHLDSFPSFTEGSLQWADYALTLLYIPAGLVLYWLFTKAEKLAQKGAERVPVIARETLCGIVIGLMGLLVPMALFSGEEEIAKLIHSFGTHAPWFLIVLSLLKIVMTVFCLRFGMKGGHFFPLIFACTCMGFGLAMLLFPEPGAHIVFAAGIVTSAVLGAQLKKPMAVSVLMLLCFPVKLLFWTFLSAVVSGRVAQLLDEHVASSAPCEANIGQDQT